MEPAVCTFFTRNACTRGTDCPFYHPRENDLPRAESATPMTFCKFDQKGSCRFGNNCKNLHKLAPEVGQGHKLVVAGARCLFFAKGQCIKGDTCKFSHSVGNEPHSLDTAGPGQANSSNHCRFWHNGTCNKGAACSYIHSEVDNPSFKRPESPVSTPPLTSHTHTTDSDEVREIISLVSLDVVGTTVPEVHLPSDEIKQQDDSRVSLADMGSDTSQKSIPLPLESDSSILSNNSDEGDSTGQSQAPTTSEPYFHVSTGISSLDDINEESKVSLIEDAGAAHLYPLLPNNTSVEYEGEEAPSANGSFSQPADIYPDGERCELHHQMPEGDEQPTISLRSPEFPMTTPDTSFERTDHSERPGTWSAWDTAPYGADQSYEEGSSRESFDKAAAVHQSPWYVEAEVVPELTQTSANAASLVPLNEPNSCMEGEGPASQSSLVSTGVPESVLHWSQYADPLADPSIPFCKFFAQSCCNQEDACSFRHSITINEYALLFRDAQPLLWSSQAQFQRSENTVTARVLSATSAFGTCKFYPLGKCRNGDMCPYLHAPPPVFVSADPEPEERWPDYSNPAAPTHRIQALRSCKYYAERGYCRNGDECKFSHEIDAQNDGWHNSSNKDPVAQPCKYFNEGNCKHGDQCDFLHDASKMEEKQDDTWGDTTSNGWGEGADGWGPPNTDGWGESTSNSWTKNDNDTRTSMAGGAVGDGSLPEQSPAHGPAEARWEEKNIHHANNSRGWRGTTTPRNSSCRLYIQGHCKWGTSCKFRHEGVDHNIPPEDSCWDVSPRAEEHYRKGVEEDAPAGDSWGDEKVASDVPLQADEQGQDTINPETPLDDSWGDTAETPWNDPIPTDDPFQLDDGSGQSDGAGKEAASSNIHKWALTVATQSEVGGSNEDDEKTWSTPWLDSVAEVTGPTRINAPCKAFGQGYCAKGDLCIFRHIAPPDPMSTTQAPAPARGSASDVSEDLEGTRAQADSDPEIIATEVIQDLSVDRNLFNCTICFGSGCIPANVLTACDSHRVLLSNISPTATHNSLQDIASSFGQISDITIDARETYANAAVEFKGPTEAIEAVKHLDGQMYDSTIIRAGLDTVATERPIHPDLISRTIKVSWSSPVRSAWVFYATITTAKAQEKRLEGLIYNGRKLKAEFHKPRPKQTHSFAVRITGLPAQSTKESIEQLCKETTLVTLDPANYESTPVHNAIPDLLANLGPLDSFDVPSWDDNQARLVGFAQFHMDTSPLEGVMALNTVPQPFLAGGSLSVQQVFHVKYRLSTCQFHAVHTEIDRLTNIYKPHGSVQFFESADQTVVLHVYGSSGGRKQFGRFNVEVQDLLQGEIMESEGSRVWDEYFAISSSAKTLEKINADNPFFIQVDHRVQALRTLGTEPNRQAARVIVSRLLKKVRAQRCVIRLDRFSMHGLLTGGYQALQEDVGLNKVTLDVVALELIVRGDSGVVGQVQLTLDTHAPASLYDTTLPDLEGGLSCPVCYRKPTNPIKLSCRHAYCQTCLQYVLQASNGLHFTPPRCVAMTVDGETEGDRQCTEIIPYIVVRDLLRTDEEEQLLKASLLHHVRNHPDEFFFCPTPNCETVYGRGRDGVVYQCPSCLTQICSSCHLQHHEGLTCSERREIRNGSEATT